MRQTVSLRVNWGAVMTDLQAAGWSLRRIADTVGDVSEAALRNARYGDMRHATGERVIQLWMRVTGCDRDELPMCDGMDVEA